MGNIYIGGIDIRSYPTEQLMQMVSYVFQDSFMFQQSLYDNIAMGMDKTREEVEDAAKAAQIHDFIVSLPDGYQTLFGQSGIHLSGGEQQRFQLARAILKDAPILILDEATAFADPENEAKIQEAFSRLIQNKTVLIIAHRLSTITDVDQILHLTEEPSLHKAPIQRSCSKVNSTSVCGMRIPEPKNLSSKTIQ